MADAYIGEIRLFAGSYCPKDWKYCEGQSLTGTLYPALYLILGNTYGGINSTSFDLPDLRGKVPMGVGQGSGLTSIALGGKVGSTSVNITIDNMPTHTHTVQGKKTSLPAVTTNDPTAHTWTSGGGNNIYATTSNVVMNTNCVVSTPSTTVAHNNIQPCIGIHYIICVIGGSFPTP